MGQLSIAWEYLTGCCVATNVADRRQAEWPPHPARVFMALAAAWFETDRDDAEWAALEWLERLGEPELVLPTQDWVYRRSVVDVYVPVNDKAGPSKAILQSAPPMTRDRQPRTFPATWVGDAVCCMYWPDACDVDKHATALSRLCGKVTRIGHPSSLVRMWVADDRLSDDIFVDVWRPSELLPEMQLRRCPKNFLALLSDSYGEAARAKHAELTSKIESLKAERKSIRGQGAKEKKVKIDRQISSMESELQTIIPGPPIPPKVGQWSGYSRVKPPPAPDVRHSQFDSDILILIEEDGPRLPLESTLSVMQALRGAVMAACRVQPLPEWVSGHAPGGKPSRSEDGHLALFPLPFVGHEYADGHLLGVALAFPRSIGHRERGRCVGPLVVGKDGKFKPVELKLGSLGTWALTKRDWADPRRAGKPETWTASPEGAEVWASVTPVVLDRFPKNDRLKNREAWNHEVAEIIKQACCRIGLPEPVAIDLDTTSWLRGAPRAIGKRRRLRNGRSATPINDAALGDGFPPFPAKGTNAPRPQVHVWLRFDQPVVGPILIGAGRFLGYGLLKPLSQAREGGQS